MNSKIILSITMILLIISFIKDKQKTKLALLKGWKSFSKLLPDVLSIMIFVGISLSIISPPMISRIIGSESGILGIVIALGIGSITMIPSFITFPLAAALLKGGAGYPQIAAFVSTLMAVGVVTLPAEMKYFDKRTALLRNGMSFAVAVIFTLVIWRVMK